MRTPLLFALALLINSQAPWPAGNFPVADRRARLTTAFADIDRLFLDYTRTAHIPGAAWGIIIDGELAHAGTTGVP